MSSLMDMLGAAGAAGGPPSGADALGAAGGSVSGPGQGTPGQPDNADAEQALQDAVDSLQAFMAAEEDDQDKAVAAKCLASLQSIFGGRQKQTEAAQGITPAHKAMGRAMKSGGAGNGGY